VPLLALTATATEQVVGDTLRMLALPATCRRFRGSVDRANLFYEVRSKPAAKSLLADMARLIRARFARQVPIVVVSLVVVVVVVVVVAN
jgi:superfamily II DNA helicase RecQ